MTARFYVNLFLAISGSADDCNNFCYFKMGLKNNRNNNKKILPSAADW
jgi:hypothetical protein